METAEDYLDKGQAFCSREGAPGWLRQALPPTHGNESSGRPPPIVPAIITFRLKPHCFQMTRCQGQVSPANNIL